MMAMAQTPCPEFAIICIDNGPRAICNPPIYQAQLKGARYYCETVLKSNADSMVSIFKMSSKTFGELVPPTNDLQKLLHALKFVPCNLIAETEFNTALRWAFSTLSRAPPKMKKRLIMFVGSAINLHPMDARKYGTKLKESSVALDVFNFCFVKRKALADLTDDENRGILNPGIFQGNYHYARPALERLITNVDSNGNSHLVDFVDEYESSVITTLSKSILKNHLHYLKKMAAADNEKNESAEDEKNKTAAGEKNKSVEAPHILTVKPDEKTKSAAYDGYGHARARARKRKGRKH